MCVLCVPMGLKRCFSGVSVTMWLPAVSVCQPWEMLKSSRLIMKPSSLLQKQVQEEMRQEPDPDCNGADPD